MWRWLRRAAEGARLWVARIAAPPGGDAAAIRRGLKGRLSAHLLKDVGGDGGGQD